MAEVTEEQAVPPLVHPIKYHAFITHCEEDLVFAKNLLEEIEQHNFRCIFAKRDFDVGAAVVDNIANAIHSSRRTVMVISRASLRSSWCQYEMLAAIDDTQKNNRISFIPVLRRDVMEDDLPHPLRFVTYIHTGREQDYVGKLVRALAAPDEDWDTHIPAGNVAHGLAWSYYFGYLKLILPGIGNRIDKCEYWQNKTMRRVMCRKILLLFPESCRNLGRLDNDPSGRITHVDDVEVRKDRAGVVGRVYKNTIYSVTSKEGEKYYFVGEFITCIETMYEMERSGMAGLKTDDTRLQATKFLITIKDILGRDKACNNQYRIVIYNDTDQTLQVPDHIVKAIQEEISDELQQAVRDRRSTSRKHPTDNITTTDKPINAVNPLPPVAVANTLIRRDKEKCELKNLEAGNPGENISSPSASRKLPEATAIERGRHHNGAPSSNTYIKDHYLPAASGIIGNCAGKDKAVQQNLSRPGSPRDYVSSSRTTCECNKSDVEILKHEANEEKQSGSPLCYDPRITGHGQFRNSTQAPSVNMKGLNASVLHLRDNHRISSSAKTNSVRIEDAFDDTEDVVDRMVRQKSCDSGTIIQKDKYGRTRTIQAGNELINILNP